MTPSEIATIQNVIRRLRGDERASPGVRAALTTGPAKLYLQTWVIPALELLLPGEKRDPRLARDLSS